MTLFFENFILIPEFFFCVTIICLILYGTIVSTTLKTKKLIIKPVVNLSILILIFSIFLFYNNLYSISIFTNYFFNSITIDYFSEIAKIIITCFTILCFCLFRNYLPLQKINSFEYIVIILLAVLGVFLLCSANDLLTAYLSIELQSLAFYLLASFKKNSSFSINAGLKYFILGSIASCLFLFSSSFIYGLTGTINLEEIFSLFNIGNLFSLLSCFDFAHQLFNFGKFGFCYSFNASFEYYILDIYFCLLELFYSYDITNSFVKINCNFENILLVLNSCFYYSNVFNFNDSFDTFFLFFTFFFENFLFLNDFFTYLLYYHTDFLKELSINIFNSFNSFFCSIFYLNFLFLNGLSNVFILNLLEFYVLSIYFFDTFSFLIAFCMDLIFSGLLLNFDNIYLLNFFLIDSIYYYFKFFHFSNTIIFLLFFYFLLFSLFFKLAVVPFNLWLPDIYEGSVSSTTAFFAIIPKLSIFIFFFRLLDYGLFNNTTTFQYYVLISGVCSILYGSFIAIEERKLKSLIAFSAISNIGFSLLAFSSLTFHSNAMVFCYFVIYMLANMLIWFVLLSYNVVKSSPNKFNKELSSFSNFYKSNKTMSFFFSFALFSIAGIPPFIGFLAKFGIFLIVLDSANYAVSIVSILGSVVAIFYYLRIIKLVFFENDDNTIKLVVPQNSFSFFIALFLLLFLLFMYPNIIYLLFFKLSYTFF
nr:NADH dehydrogenase subunit 2 [Actinocyclus sp. mgcode 4]